MNNRTENLIVEDGWEKAYNEPNEPDMHIFNHELFPNVDICVDRDGSWIANTTSPTEVDMYRYPLYLEEIQSGEGPEDMAGFLQGNKLLSFKKEQNEETTG